MKKDKQKSKQEGVFFWGCRERREQDKMDIEVELA